MTVEWLGQPACPDGFYWSAINSACTPVCSSGQFWNDATKQCQNSNPCWPPQVYDQATQRCVFPLTFLPFTPGGQQTFVPGGQQFVPGQSTLPPPMSSTPAPGPERVRLPLPPLQPTPPPSKPRSILPIFLVAIGIAGAVGLVVADRGLR